MPRPQQKSSRPLSDGHAKPRAGHARPLRVNQQIKNPPLPPQQHQLKILHTNKYIQNDRQKDPGLPLGWAAAHLVSAMVAQRTGIAIVPMLGAPELMLAGLMVFCGLVLALLPAWLCYRRPVVEALR
mgnify:CR=1 FL=1